MFTAKVLLGIKTTCLITFLLWILTLFFLQVATFSPAVGSRVWVEDADEAWLDGEVVEISGEQIKVLCTSGKQVCAFHMFSALHCVCLCLALEA